MKLRDSFEEHGIISPWNHSMKLRMTNTWIRIHQLLILMNKINKRKSLTTMRSGTCLACSGVESLRSSWLEPGKERISNKTKIPGMHKLSSLLMCTQIVSVRGLPVLTSTVLPLCFPQSLSLNVLKARKHLFPSIQHFSICSHFSRNLSHVLAYPFTTDQTSLWKNVM